LRIRNARVGSSSLLAGTISCDIQKVEAHVVGIDLVSRKSGFLARTLSGLGLTFLPLAEAFFNGLPIPLFPGAIALGHLGE
jgi:hypothetical protein